MTTWRVRILLVFVVGVLGGCLSEMRDGDPDPDLDADPAIRRRPNPNPNPNPVPAPAPVPDPGNVCSPVGGPSTLGATLDGIDYEVTGGPTGGGNGTSLHMAQSGWTTLHTRERGTEQGWLDGLTLYSLFRKGTSAELPTLCAMYSCDGCGDDYIHNLSVVFNGVPYKVRASFRSSPPARLTALINAVQALRPLQ